MEKIVINTMKYKLYSEVVFNQDINEHHIKKGDIATIIDIHCQNEKINEPGYTLEIFDGIGNTLNVVTVPESKIEKIKANDILTTRKIEFA